MGAIGKETLGLFPGEHQTIVLTCVANQKQTQKSQAHLHWYMPAEPLHCGLSLPAAWAALRERNTILVVLKFVVLCDFVQPLSQNDVYHERNISSLEYREKIAGVNGKESEITQSVFSAYTCLS